MGERYRLLPHRNRSSLTVGGCVSATERHDCHGEGPKDGCPKRTVRHMLTLTIAGEKVAHTHPAANLSTGLKGCLMGPRLAPRAITSFPLSPLHHFLFAKPSEIQVALIHWHGSHERLHPNADSGVLGKFEPYIHDPFIIISTLRKKATKESHCMVCSFFRLW